MFFWLMELTKRSEAVTFKRTISISDLQKDKQYRITNAVRVNTNFGPSIVMRLEYEANTAYRVYLPNRYFTLFKDKYIQ
jgi:hypothetical protein